PHEGQTPEIHECTVNRPPGAAARHGAGWPRGAKTPAARACASRISPQRPVARSKGPVQVMRPRATRRSIAGPELAGDAARESRLLGINKTSAARFTAIIFEIDS